MSSAHTDPTDLLQKQLADARARIAVLEAELRQATASRGTVARKAETPEELLHSATLLRRSKNRYRKYFNYASDAMFVILPDKTRNTYGRFTDVNKEATRRLGYSRDEFFAMTPQDINLSSRRSNMEYLFQHLYQDGSARCESVHVAKDGRQIPVEISPCCLTSTGRS